MILKIKKLVPDAKIPAKATSGSACYDIYSVESYDILPDELYTFKTGLAFEIPLGHMLEVRPRGGLSRSKVLLANSPCTIDSDYRGELLILLFNLGKELYGIKKGDRIAQVRLVESPEIQFKEVKELSETERGQGGLGSTGR